MDAVNSVDLTGIGAGQVQNWGTWYAQGRFNWKRLFGQVFWNKNDNDDTYLLRSGRPLIDKSYQTVAQLQHGFDFNPQHGLTYGFDYLYTNPQSEGTINGRHEDDDDVTEMGGYVQYDGRLSPKWNVVAAARLDDHTRLQDPVFSPRAALVFSPTPERSIRASYNRAFSTPNTLNLFLDISAQPHPARRTVLLRCRAQGTYGERVHVRADGGVPQHMSPFIRDGGPGPTFDPRHLRRRTAPDVGRGADCVRRRTQAQCAIPAILSALLLRALQSFGPPRPRRWFGADRGRRSRYRDARRSSTRRRTFDRFLMFRRSNRRSGRRSRWDTRDCCWAATCCWGRTSTTRTWTTSSRR